MAEESDMEKTEEASLSRLEKAREEGDIPRSKELATCTVLLAAGMGIWILGGGFSIALKKVFTSSFMFERNIAFDPSLMLVKMISQATEVLWVFAPLAVIFFVVAIASPILVGGWSLNQNALMPKFSRLNPISGMSNIISINSLVELVKAILKSVLVGTVAYFVITHDFSTFLTLLMTPLDIGIVKVLDLLIKAFLITVSSLILIAVIDVIYQLKHYSDKMKMSKYDLRQESKESNGNPEIKAQIRRQQREMARRRMMSDIPKADVIITNPTHYAVAIQYAETGMTAPKILAKGADEIALKIREIGKENKVLVVESPKLARALFANSEIGEEIPAALYVAVAEVLAFVYQLRSYNTHGGVYPDELGPIGVPDYLDPLHPSYALGGK
jgi:flagellar biosynthetic protein FlhB